MATMSGRYARVVLGTNVIQHLGSWEINVNADEIDVPEFGSVWQKSEVGALKWSGSLSGNAALEDTQGQELLWDALESGTPIQDIRFYEKYVANPSATDPAYFLAPDTNADSEAGVIITSVRKTVAHNGLVTLEISFSGSGPLARFKDDGTTVTKL